METGEKQDKNKEQNLLDCLLSILDSLKLYDTNSLELGDETLSEMMFRKMKAYGIDLNKELEFTHLKPITKNYKIEIKFTKVDEVNPNPNINIGSEITGYMMNEPCVGKSFIVLHGTKIRVTSPVIEIISPNKFRTENSTYYWEVID